MESAAASSTPYGTTAQFEEWQGAASVGVPCCGLGCSVASVARQHFCVVCKQNCCAICQWKTADGGDNELAKWIVCIRHRGEGGGSNSSGQGGDIVSAGAASQGSAAPIVNDVVRTVTPPPEEAEVVDAAINAILPTITAEQRQRAVSLIAGKGNIYNTNMNFLCRKVDFSRKKGMVIGSALKPNNVSASVATPNHWLCVTNNSLEEAVIHVCVFNRLLTKEQQKAEKTLYTNMPAGIKKKLAKRKDRLNNQKRPAPLPSANDVGGNDGAAASAPRRSIRNLNQTSIATSQDPRRQQIARERAGPILIRGQEHMGMTSTSNQRTDLLNARTQQQKGAVKRRKIGEYATSAGQQADSQSNKAVHRMYKQGAAAMDTMHYPKQGANQPRRLTMTVEYTEVEASNPNGGRVTTRALSQPRLTVMAPDKDTALRMMKEGIKQLRETEGRKSMQLETIYRKEDTTMVEQIKEREKKMKRNQPARKHLTDEQVQRDAINPSEYNV